MDDKDVDQHRIEQIAYHFWVERGCPLGSPDEDWFRAEQQLADSLTENFRPVTPVISGTARTRSGPGRKAGA